MGRQNGKFRSGYLTIRSGSRVETWAPLLIWQFGRGRLINRWDKLVKYVTRTTVIKDSDGVETRSMWLKIVENVYRYFLLHYDPHIAQVSPVLMNLIKRTFGSCRVNDNKEFRSSHALESWSALVGRKCMAEVFEGLLGSGIFRTRTSFCYSPMLRPIYLSPWFRISSRNSNHSLWSTITYIDQ